MTRKEDLHFKGKDYNWGNTIFLIVYTLGQIPSNIAMTYIPPRIWFTSMQFGWAIICLCQYAAKNVATSLALRALMGLFESSTFVGMHLIFGSWYTPKEIGKRTALFISAAQVGSIVSGFIQGGLYKNMNGYAGLAGWQWLFIIDFIITLPIIVYGFFFFPDFPHNTTCRWLSAEDKKMCIARIPNKAVTKPVWNLATFRRIASSWQLYLFPLLFTMYGTAFQVTGNNTMPFTMELHGDHNVEHLNYYPTGMTAAGIAACWVYSLMSDFLKTRIPASICIGVVFIIAGAILLAPGVPYAAKLFAFYLAGTGMSPQALWYAWANDLTRADFELRVVVNGAMNTLMEAFIAWWPLVFFPANSKNFHKGFTATIILGALIVCLVVVIWFVARALPPKEVHEEDVIRAVDSNEDSLKVPEANITEAKLEVPEPGLPLPTV